MGYLCGNRAIWHHPCCSPPHEHGAIAVLALLTLKLAVAHPGASWAGPALPYALKRNGPAAAPTENMEEPLNLLSRFSRACTADPVGKLRKECPTTQQFMRLNLMFCFIHFPAQPGTP